MKLIKKIFGKRFAWADLILILAVAPAIYFTFKGITFDAGWLAVYMKFIALPLTFITVSKLVLQNIVKSALK